MFSGQIPDHTVVVLNCDIAQGKITVFDPYSPDTENVCTIGQFEDAWADSKNYLVTVISENMSTYIPKPINLSDVELTEDLNELREAIAENAHEIWAENRQKEGWTYGPERNDELKQNPDMELKAATRTIRSSQRPRTATSHMRQYAHAISERISTS